MGGQRRNCDAVAFSMSLLLGGSLPVAHGDACSTLAVRPHRAWVLSRSLSFAIVVVSVVVVIVDVVVVVVVARYFVFFCFLFHFGLRFPQQKHG